MQAMQSVERQSFNVLTHKQRTEIVPLFRELQAINRLMSKLAFDLERDPLFYYDHKEHEDRIIGLKKRFGEDLYPKTIKKAVNHCSDCVDVYFVRYWKVKDMETLADMAIEVEYEIYLKENDLE